MRYLGWVGLGLASVGCGEVLGFGDYQIGSGGAGVGAGTATGSMTGNPTGTGNPTAGPTTASGSTVSTMATGSGTASSSSTGVPLVSGELQWAKSYGGVGDQIAWGTAIAPDGSVYLGGVFQNELTIVGTMTTSAQAMFVAKLAPDGTPVWAQHYQFSSTGPYNNVYGLAADDSGVYVAGMADGQLGLTSAVSGAFVAKFDAAGNPGWVKGCGGSSAYDIDDNGGSMVMKPFNGQPKLYVAIPSSGGVTCGGGSGGNLLLRIDPASGAVEMGAPIDGDTYEYRATVAPRVDGEAYYGDRDAMSRVSPTGSIISTSPCNRAVALAVDDFSSDVLGVFTQVTGNNSCGGTPPTPPPNASTFFFRRLNAQLNHVMTLEITENGAGKALVIAPDRDVVLGGDYSFAADFGSGELPSMGMLDSAVAVYDSNMQLRWAKPINGTGADQITAVAVDANYVVAVGHFDSATANFGGQSFVGTNQKDIWIAKIAK